MALIIDGVFLQLERPDSTRMWRELLPLIARNLEMPVVLLDRGGRREQVPGIEVVPYPSYKPKFNTQDSALLERVCRHYGASAFMSTHFTTPLQTPSALFVHDLLAERSGIELATREVQEKEIAIAHARRYVCRSRETCDDLLASYPELSPSIIRVADAPIDAAITAFRPSTESQSWAPMAEAITQTIHELAAESRAGVYEAFYETWARLRALQGEVDVTP